MNKNIYKLTFNKDRKQWDYSKVEFEFDMDFHMPGEEYEEVSFSENLLSNFGPLDETVKFVNLSSDEDAARLVNRWNRDLATGYREIHTCKDCGKVFFINAKEKDWYAKKKFQLPKRCKSCRVEKKKKAEVTINNVQ